VVPTARPPLLQKKNVSSKLQLLPPNCCYYSVEKDANMLANRIALLKQEEMRTWKKIEETKKRAQDVMRLKQRNNDRVQQKMEYHQEREFEKKMMVEQNMRQRLINQQEKEKIIQAIKDSKAEEAAQAKMKA